MGRVLHGCAATTAAVRRAIQNSQESLRALAKRYGINQKTVVKWKKRTSAADLPTGPKEPRSTVLSAEEEAIVVAFRKHTLLPLDDCLYALQPTIPHLSRSSLHRCLQRHGISRLPDVGGDRPAKKKFKVTPIGFFHIDIAEVPTAEGKLYLFVAIDRTSKFAFAELHAKATTRIAADFLRAVIDAAPYEIHTALTDNGVHFTDPGGGAWSPAEIRLRSRRRRSSADQTKASMDQRPGRADEPNDQGRHRQTLPLSQPRTTPAASRLLRSPTLDRRRLEFSGSDHDDGLGAPPGLCRSIGTLYPIALWGLTSL